MAIIVNVNGKQVTMPDAKIDAPSDVRELAGEIKVSEGDLLKLLNGVTLTAGETIELDDLIAKAVAKQPPEDAAKAGDLLEKAGIIESKLNNLKTTIAQLTAKVAELKTKADAPNAPDADKTAYQTEKQNLEIAQTLENALKWELQDAVQQLKAVVNKDFSNKADIKAFVDKHAPEGAAAPGKPQSPGSQQPGAPAAPQTPQTAGKAAGAGDIGYGYGQNPGLGNGGFNPVALAGAKFSDDMIDDAYNIIGEQKKRQQMMQLFFHYARMAMSGDIGAMYHFMRFIGYVIGRDKAMQNVWMGTKLIQLQEISRKATQRLLNMDVKENDLDSQTEWQKELQKIKSEEGIVATSQKLIAQMMEEFTQIVETLTNVQKSLLDANGRVMAGLSTWR